MVTANRWGMGFTGAELNKDVLYQHVGRSHNQHATSEDEELIIDIKWNDKVEEIVLKSES